MDAVQHISISIDRTPGDVYAFIRNPANLPRWASGLANGIERIGDEWVAQSPMGAVTVRFVDENSLGVVDHDVRLPTGEVVTNPMRVLPNGDGSEVVFTLFRRAGMTDVEYETDAATIRADLATLKAVLEH